MHYVNSLITDQSIVMVFDEGTKVCTRSHASFDKVKNLIQRGKPMDALAEFDITLKLKKHSSGAFFVESGVVYMDNINPVPMPTALSSRVIQFADAGLNFKPLVSFWNNIQKNPKPEAVKDLYAFLEHNGISITEDGCFCAYKGVEADYRSNFAGVWKQDSDGNYYNCGSERYDNTPGNRVEMPREMVDDNRDVTCSSGLHVAAFEYANGFCKRLVLVKVNPADVVSVPTDYNGQKMRTCGYDVLKDVTEEVKVPLYTDDTDDDFDSVDIDDIDDIDENDGLLDDDTDDFDDEDVVVSPGIQTIMPDKSGRVCVPAAYVKALGLKPGQVANIYLLDVDGLTSPIKILADMAGDPDYQYVVDRDSNIRLSRTCVATSKILDEFSEIQVEIEDNSIVLS